ncbi:MAG TPA: type II secretion system protein [Candidatus Saccharimonadales bacterium]|nr:type II secretion system protein [Candidatus Saccharimonadales bacterium]
MKNTLQKIRSQQSGFTLIELLIVITIIAALAVTVFVALNPVKRLQDSRDSRRSADVETILTAVHEYVVDNKGSLPTGLTTSMAEKMLGTGASGCTLTQANCVTTTAACLDISTPLNKYLKSIPVDPGATYSAALTGYSVTVDANNIVTVKACGGENNQAISQSR